MEAKHTQKKSHGISSRRLDESTINEYNERAQSQDTFGCSQVYIPAPAEFFFFEQYEHARSEGMFGRLQVHIPTRLDFLCNRVLLRYAVLAGGRLF